MRAKPSQVLVIAVAVLVLGMVLYASIRPAGLNPAALWCISRYERALSATDTANVDRLNPPSSAPPIACGVERKAGRLKR